MSKVKKEYLKDKDGESFSPIYSLCSLKTPNDKLKIKYDNGKIRFIFNNESIITKNNAIILNDIPETYEYIMWFEGGNMGKVVAETGSDMNYTRNETVNGKTYKTMHSYNFKTYSISSEAKTNSNIDENNLEYYVQMGKGWGSAPSGWDSSFENALAKCNKGEKYVLYMGFLTTCPSELTFELSCASEQVTVTSNNSATNEYFISLVFTYNGDNDGQDTLTVKQLITQSVSDNYIGIYIDYLTIAKYGYSSRNAALNAKEEESYLSESIIELNDKGQIICNTLKELDNIDIAKEMVQKKFLEDYGAIYSLDEVYISTDSEISNHEWHMAVRNSDTTTQIVYYYVNIYTKEIYEDG